MTEVNKNKCVGVCPGIIDLSEEEEKSKYMLKAVSSPKGKNWTKVYGMSNIDIMAVAIGYRAKYLEAITSKLRELKNSGLKPYAIVKYKGVMLLSKLEFEILKESKKNKLFFTHINARWVVNSIPKKFVGAV